MLERGKTALSLGHKEPNEADGAEGSNPGRGLTYRLKPRYEPGRLQTEPDWKLLEAAGHQEQV